MISRRRNAFKTDEFYYQNCISAHNDVLITIYKVAMEKVISNDPAPHEHGRIQV